VVFCRNVLIYFGNADVGAFLDRLAHWLLPGQWLFVGYSESLWQVTEAFRLERLGDAFAYQRVESAAPPAPARNPGRRDTAGRSRPVPADPLPRRERRPGRTDPPSRAEPRSRPAPVAAPAVDDVQALLAAGEAASAAGDHAGAAASFRKAAYLDPEQPAAHLQLGLALEAAGDATAAQRAYRAARAALGRSGVAAVEAALEGFSPSEVARFLELKLGTDQ
jgi:tetratricopeptide (TPR) repeat protein